MLDLRGSNSFAQPDRTTSTGVPGVGTTDVSFTPPPRHSSPVMEAGSNAPAGRGISGVVSTKKDPIVLVVAIVSVALAGAAGLIGSYLVTQQQTKLISNTSKYDELVVKLHTGETGKNLQLIQTTAEQIKILTASKAQTPWVPLLDALGTQIPGAIQLKNAAFDSSTKLLTMSGSANTYEDIAHAIAALEASDRFSGVNLQNAAASQVETTIKVDFSIVATYLPTQPVVAATKVVPTATQGATP